MMTLELNDAKNMARPGPPAKDWPAGKEPQRRGEHHAPILTGATKLVNDGWNSSKTELVGWHAMQSPG